MKKLTTTLENYLEAIYEAQTNSNAARSKDIAARLGVNPATVTSALRSLVELGLIRYEPYGPIVLTEQGLLYASNVAKRHVILAGFFAKFLGVAPQIADDAACRAEHVLGDDVMDKLSMLMQMLESCPRIMPKSAECVCCCKKESCNTNEQ